MRGIEVVLASIESSLLVRLVKGIQIQTSFELAHTAEERFDPIVVPGLRVVTSQAPGTSIEFALSVVRMLRGPKVASELETYLMISQPHIQK